MAPTAHENRELARRWNEEIWGEHDLVVVEEYVAPDFVGHDPSIPEPVRGPEGVREQAEVILSAWSDVRVEIEDLVAEGDLVAQRFTMTGTHEGEFVGIEPTGEEVEVTGMSIHRVEDGQFVEERQLIDWLGMFVQLGVVEPPGE